MSRRKREMALPPHQTGSAPSNQIGSAPASAIQVPTPVPALLCGGSIPSTGGQPAAWWSGPFPQATSSAGISTNCGMNYYPPGGFMNFLQSGQPFIPQVSAPPTNGPGNQNAKKRSKDKAVINLEDGNNGRIAKRLVFEPKEDVRLVSAWVIHSNDPINGNCKKNEKYWGDVHELYNRTTPTNREVLAQYLY